jgi:predicted GH43/DUF377 family glycosyl hydrolase
MAPPPNRNKLSQRPRPAGFEPSKPVAKSPGFKRPPTHLLTSTAARTTRLDLPHGCFNAGLVAIPGSTDYVSVYRPDEHTFTACILNKDFQIQAGRMPLGITNCADPRLVWVGAKLLMVYSSYDTGSFKNECIRGAVIAEQLMPLPGDPGLKFIKPEPFRISLPGEVRQKNWTPFVIHGKVYLTATIKPHLVYELSSLGRFAQPCSESEWQAPWFNTEFFRGNTNPVLLDDGNYLGTFHTVVKDGNLHYYDNGCYVFEAKPPFKVVRCSAKTFLPAEAAVEPHFRKAGKIKVCFPVGMVREGSRLLISYGDNDSSVKIMETTVADMLGTTVEVY